MRKISLRRLHGGGDSGSGEGKAQGKSAQTEARTHEGHAREEERGRRERHQGLLMIKSGRYREKIVKVRLLDIRRSTFLYHSLLLA